MTTTEGLSMATSLLPAFRMEAGYTPEHFPNQNKMQQLAMQAKDSRLQRALLDFQYPFRTKDLMQTNYSDDIKRFVLEAASS